ncbi:MAG: DUF2235 domain-containing protein [Pseudomonadota bacterium]
MKRIAVFCDGTWNRRKRHLLRKTGRNPTNVALLYECFIQTSRDTSRSAEETSITTTSDGVEQVAAYIDGVGTPDKGGWGHKTRALFDRLGGGAFGWGLDGKVLRAYRYLIDTYETDDEIYLFGFSRGSYTARSLVGLLRNCGLPTKEALEEYPDLEAYLMSIYRSRDARRAPKEDWSRRLRELVNPNVVTSREDLAKAPNADQCEFLRIAYMGIFDTVSSLGIPEIRSRDDGARHHYTFHDQELSDMVVAARHAVAVDEPRVTYRSQPWTQESIDRLNARSEAAGGEPIRQLWFPGVHGTIGGSLAGENRGIANATMDWIVEGAEAAGLKFDTEKLAGYRAPIAPDGPFMTPGTDCGALDKFTKWVRPYTRKPPPDVSKIAGITKDRWMDDRPKEQGVWPYRPASLKKLAKDAGWPD